MNMGAMAGAMGGGGGGMSGGMIGGIVKGIIGGGQWIAGQIKQDKADGMLPAIEDPGQRKMLNYYSRQRNALNSGTASGGQRNALNQMMQSGIKQSFKYGAGARGLNAMANMYNQGLLGLNEQDRTQSMEVANQETALQNIMAQRRLELGMERYDREQARAANLKSKGSRTLSSAVGSVVGEMGDGGVKSESGGSGGGSGDILSGITNIFKKGVSSGAGAGAGAGAGG